MNIVILDDYQDAVRKLRSASRLAPYSVKVFTNTVKGLGQLSVRLKDADIIVLIRERTQITRQLLDKLPRLKLVVQTGRLGSPIDVEACTARGIAHERGQQIVLVRAAPAQRVGQRGAAGKFVAHDRGQHVGLHAVVVGVGAVEIGRIDLGRGVQERARGVR